MDDDVRIEPVRASAPLGKLHLTDRHELIFVDDDVLGVARHLRSIDPGLAVYYNRRQGVFVIFHEAFNPQGEWTEHLIGAYLELDERVIRLIERIDQQGRGHSDLATELEALEAAKDREQEQRFHDAVGDAAERLSSGLRKDLGIHSRAFFQRRP